MLRRQMFANDERLVLFAFASALFTVTKRTPETRIDKKFLWERTSTEMDFPLLYQAGEGLSQTPSQGARLDFGPEASHNCFAYLSQLSDKCLSS